MSSLNVSCRDFFTIQLSNLFRRTTQVLHDSELQNILFIILDVLTPLFVGTLSVAGQLLASDPSVLHDGFMVFGPKIPPKKTGGPRRSGECDAMNSTKLLLIENLGTTRG